MKREVNGREARCIKRREEGIKKCQLLLPRKRKLTRHKAHTSSTASNWLTDCLDALMLLAGWLLLLLFSLSLTLFFLPLLRTHCCTSLSLSLLVTLPLPRLSSLTQDGREIERREQERDSQSLPSPLSSGSLFLLRNQQLFDSRWVSSLKSTFFSLGKSFFSLLPSGHLIGQRREEKLSWYFLRIKKDVGFFFFIKDLIFCPREKVEKKRL